LREKAAVWDRPMKSEIERIRRLDSVLSEADQLVVDRYVAELEVEFIRTNPPALRPKLRLRA
jgi:hypothetical protein